MKWLATLPVEQGVSMAKRLHISLLETLMQ
jgi:hypothetical protein